MISGWMMRALAVSYVALMITCGIERRWEAALYWFGALIINLSILWGMK